MDLGFDKVAKLPNKQKIIILIALLLAVAALSFFFLLKPKYTELNELKVKLDTLQQQIQKDRQVAANLPALLKEYDKLNRELAAALTELPNQKEIPALLTSVTDEGKKAGLDFLVFKPGTEVKLDFYASVPVDITVAGSFKSVGDFFAAVGSLPRIVNISNVNFSDIKSAGERTTLKVTCLATTFRFLDKKEQNDAKTVKK
ncbi:MAG: type 4a pilus biogenesis protein PilO [Geobacteraceae bacterium]|nr:type 4a pilus biogenesis protein PilO [Geobacteraceae bacterium]